VSESSSFSPEHDCSIEITQVLVIFSGEHKRVLPYTVDEVGCFIRKSHTSDRSWDYGLVMIGGQLVGAHRLVLAAKLGRALHKQEWCCHECDNPKCIRPEHLFICSPQENTQDCLSKKRRKTYKIPPRRGEANNNAKLTEADIPVIRQALKQGVPQRKIARQFGVHQAVISGIKTGKLWKHVPLEE
jgi:hypothetical protein